LIKEATIMVSTEDRAVRYIDKMPPAISGSGGHNAALAVASVLVHGFGFDEETSFRLFVERFNSRCDPQWNEGEIWHKLKSASNTAASKPKGYLLEMACRPQATQSQTSFARPTKDDCKAIARSRDLHGPGVWLAAQLGVVRVGEWHGERVWGICDAGADPVAIRRIDGELLSGYGALPERKTHCFARGEGYHKPVGWIQELPQAASIALCEGLPDYLALWEQVLWESGIEAINGDPYDLGDIDEVRAKIQCLPLCMLAAPARVEGDSVAWFSGKKVRVFVHNEGAGRTAAKKWATAIAPVAERVDLFECGKVKDEPGFDFNDCYQLFSERVLP
jgi:hypothetical protein